MENSAHVKLDKDKITSAPKVIPEKEQVLANLANKRESAIAKYTKFFVGQSGLLALAKYEVVTSIIRPMPGAFGYLLRKWFYPVLFKYVGVGVHWGQNVTVRHPGKIEIGDRTAIDDECMLCARGALEGGFKIGKDVLIARASVIQVKSGFVEIGDNCSIGPQSYLGASGGIKLGKYVMVSGQCYLGGGRYRTDRADIPMAKQDIYSQGPVEIGDDCWIGMGVSILDGVKIGRGSVIGAGAVIRENIPEFTIVTPHQRMIMLKRETVG